MAMTTKQAAEKWSISDRRVRVLCAQGKVEGAWRQGKLWLLPEGAAKPGDGRFKSEEALMEQIAAQKAALKSLRPLTEGERERLGEDFAIEYTYNSIAIGGNSLSLRETAMALRGSTVTGKPLKDHLEAVGHKAAFYCAAELAKHAEPLSEQAIKQLHALVLADKPRDGGVYRQVPVSVLGAKREPLPPCLIQPKMQQLLQQYEQSGQNIVEKLAALHVGFEAICPFVDGNGRTGRLVVNLELMKAGFPPINIRVEDRQRYYAALENEKEMAKLLAEYLNKQLHRFLTAIY